MEYPQLFRLTRPYYDSIFLNRTTDTYPDRDPSAFRPVTEYEPPIGLQPRKFRPGLVEFYPSFGIAQSFDSNVDLTPDNPIADLYVTPRAGIEIQLGTPDSAFIERYDTLLAANFKYEASGDIFFTHPEFDAFNQKLSLTTRIGRSVAIWRPYFYFSDETGSNLITTDLTNRVRRIRASPGLTGEYKFTSVVSARQTFTFTSFTHPDPAYIDFATFDTRQELDYLALHDTNALLWTGYRHTEPDRGSPGNEAFLGLGWRGKPDPRLVTELYLGYGFVQLDSPPPGSRNSSGLRFDGRTTFQWGPRFALTAIYDRGYVFNELDSNDNFVVTLLQFKGEFYLGDNWYLTPYLGVGFNEFETSRALTLQYRPELELSYAFPTETNPNASRIFAKIAYSHSENLKGVGSPIDGTRASLGFAWTF